MTARDAQGKQLGLGTISKAVLQQCPPPQSRVPQEVPRHHLPPKGEPNQQSQLRHHLSATPVSQRVTASQIPAVTKLPPAA